MKNAIGMLKLKIGVAPSPLVPTEANVRNTVTMEMFSDYRYLTVNGAVCAPGYTGNNKWRNVTTLHVFALSYTSGEHSNYVKARCYGIQFWKSADFTRAGALTLIADFHPAVDVKGVPGLYDTVSGMMFYNGSGQGGFAVGPKLATGGVVVAKSAGETIGVTDPEAGTYTDLEKDKSYTYASDETFYANQNAYLCSGYTTATSEDGSVWSDESALVGALSCSHVYDGTWWRLTWQWSQAGYQILATVPDGATVESPTSTGGLAPTYYPSGTEVTLTASASDGHGGTFYAWRGDLGAVDVVGTSFDRTVVVTADRVRSLYAVYRHAWQWVEDSEQTKVTDGVWTFEYADGELGKISGTDAVGTLDLTDLERDLGVRVTRTKDWPVTNPAHVGPADLTDFIAPDVTYLGAFTFHQSKRLRRVVLSPALSHVGRAAFYWCFELSDLTPSFETIVNQADFSEAEPYVFTDDTKIPGADIVVSKRGDFTIPAYLFSGTSFRSFDFSACRGLATFTKTTPTGSSEPDPTQKAFHNMPNLTEIVLPRRMNCLPRGLFWTCKNLTKVYCAGVIPSPENIEYFWGYENYKMTFFVSKRLNPTVVTDLQLRTEPTEAELARADFPTEAYEKGRFLGIFETPTSGWGEAEKDYTRKFYVVDWKAPAESDGLAIFLK